MARKNNFETIANLIKNEMMAYTQQAVEASQRGDYGNAFVAQISSSVFSRALSMVNACNPNAFSPKIKQNESV